MLGTEVDLQQVENSVFALETVLKAWLREQGGDREHLRLLLPSPSDNPAPGKTSRYTLTHTHKPSSVHSNHECMELYLTHNVLYQSLMAIGTVCVKCDMQERLISPALIPLTPNLGVKTESIRDFLPIIKGLANQSPAPQRLKVIK